MRRGGKRQQRGSAQAFEINLAVHVRKEIHSDAGFHAFFIAQEKDFLELRQAAAVDGENNFIDDMFAEQIGKLGQWPDRIAARQFHLGLRIVIG
jgi:hypothetical protein